MNQKLKELLIIEKLTAMAMKSVVMEGLMMMNYLRMNMFSKNALMNLILEERSTKLVMKGTVMIQELITKMMKLTAE